MYNLYTKGGNMRTKIVCEVKYFKNEVFEDYMKTHNLSKSGFCKLCKISYSTFNKILTDDFNIRISVFDKIYQATGIKFTDMVNKVPNDKIKIIRK